MSKDIGLPPVLKNRKTQEAADELKKYYDQFPDRLAEITNREWVLSYEGDENTEIWASKNFIAVVNRFANGIERLNFHRTQLDIENGRFKDGITWDELMELKRQCGRGHKSAIEWYPKDDMVIDTANTRRLLIVPDDLIKHLPPDIRPAQKFQSADITKNTPWN